MDNRQSAILFALNHLNLSPPSDEMLIMGGFDALYSSHFPKARFYSPFAGEVAQWAQAKHLPLSKDYTPRYVLIHTPQQSNESDFVIASALSVVAPNRLIMRCADNQAGGKTLSKRLSNFGCTTQDLSKQKCRVAWTQTPQIANQSIIATALKTGGIQKRTDEIYTQPGVFSWNHRDIGTDILLRHLPQNLSGNGADFGCGLGELSRFILNRYPDISALTCIDHDQRSIDCCIKNTSDFAQKTFCIWQDIPTQTNITGLDFIVMNPPFHTGKTEDKSLGKAFITKAHSALKSKGKLYMVANAHLPYEDLLQSLFGSISLLAKENGFKIFEAIR